jgi:hypothetical protein
MAVIRIRGPLTARRPSAGKESIDMTSRTSTEFADALAARREGVFAEAELSWSVSATL